LNFFQTDEILPRVCSLAEHSLDRQTKVAACELLQATLMIMIGNSAFQARGGKEPVKSPYHRLYTKIFPILLRLAINTDQTIRDIIRPLLSQMIHWLTNNAQYENPETIALLNTCIDGVCDVNGTLQDYSAECLHEFVKWSIKQTDVKVGDMFLLCECCGFSIPNDNL
jgi:DNA-dependent protein kinase catalytic subunit